MSTINKRIKSKLPDKYDDLEDMEKNLRVIRNLTYLAIFLFISLLALNFLGLY